MLIKIKESSGQRHDNLATASTSRGQEESTSKIKSSNTGDSDRSAVTYLLKTKRERT